MTSKPLPFPTIQRLAAAAQNMASFEEKADQLLRLDFPVGSKEAFLCNLAWQSHMDMASCETSTFRALCQQLVA